jgi:hypothetical protein
VSLRTSKESETLPSWIGLFFTVLVIGVSSVYLLLRLDVLMNFKETDITSLETKNALPNGTVFNLTVGDHTDEESLDFKIMIDFWDFDTFLPPVDMDNIGTVKFYQY